MKLSQFVAVETKCSKRAKGGAFIQWADQLGGCSCIYLYSFLLDHE